MKSSYINKYEYTEEMCRRTAGYVYYRRTFAAVLHIILIMVSIAGTAITAYYLASGIDPEYHYSTYIFYALAPIAAEIAVYIKYRKMIEREKSVLRGEKSEMTVSVREDKLCENVNGEMVCEKSLFDVEKVYESKSFFLVTALSQEYFIFKKGCFTEGEEGSFASDVKNRVKEIHKAAIEKSKKK